MKKGLRLIALLLSLASLNLIAPVASAESISGDINGDGYITSDDSRLALRFSAGMEKPTTAQKKASDMNGDGVVTLADVKLIMAEALDLEAYEEALLRKGFPQSYIEDLVELHKKYPEWEFVPLVTGLDWQDSVDGERTPHKKQLIENSVKSSYMCSCSSCKGVIQEASNWVSASEEAVAYYMDPRNFLTEKYIFQFESTAYESSHTKTGVESILEGTWMHNSEITYLNTVGNTKTYEENGVAVEYSDVILKAAKASGLSAYYIASKIVQEVGSSSASNAGGASGKNAPFNGIYNYYNIGAYTGVRDGLEWANGFMKTIRSTVMYKSASTSGTKVVTIPSNTEVYYISTSGDYYRLRAVVDGTTYSGYVLKSNISAYTSYGRPWTSPYKTIYYGAQYIYDSFSETQYTGYLQKFNVNPESDTLYGHEYMANVRAAAAEAKKTYNAYIDMGLLESKKTFVIPVFKNMPDDTSSSDSSTSTEAQTQSGYVSITDGYLNIRASASTSADVLAQLENGFSLTILGTSGDWYKVRFTLNGSTVTGYGYKDYIKIGTYTGGSTSDDEKEACPYTEPTVTLRQGDSGDSVRWLQWYLYKLGYLTEGDIDGSFGPTTNSAVLQFQTDKSLDVDGLVGSGTRSALKTAYGI